LEEEGVWSAHGLKSRAWIKHSWYGLWIRCSSFSMTQRVVLVWTVSASFCGPYSIGFY